MVLGLHGVFFQPLIKVVQPYLNTYFYKGLKILYIVIYINASAPFLRLHEYSPCPTTKPAKKRQVKL